MIGLNLRELTPQEKEKLGLTVGLKVVGPVTGYLKAETNICENFIITAINGHPVTGIKELEEALESSEGVMIEGVYPDGTPDHYYTKGLPC